MSLSGTRSSHEKAREQAGDGQESRLVQRAEGKIQEDGHGVESLLKHCCCNGWNINHFCLFISSFRIQIQL